MRIDFDYTIEDLRELMHVARRNKDVRRQPGVSRASKGIFGWVLFIGLMLVFVWDLKLDHPRLPSTGEETLTIGSFWQRMLIPALPWLLVGCFVIFVLLRVRFPSTSILRKQPEFQQPISMEVDGSGVFSSEGPTETRWKWGAFDRVVETEGRFFLRLSRRANHFLLIPKRAIAGPQGIDQVRAWLQNGVQAGTGAFPVIPLSVQDQLPQLPVASDPDRSRA